MRGADRMWAAESCSGWRLHQCPNTSPPTVAVLLVQRAPQRAWNGREDTGDSAATDVVQREWATTTTQKA